MKDNFLRLVILLLISCLPPMTGAPVIPSLPKILNFFEGEANAELLVRLFLTMPYLFTAIGAPLAGYFIDRFGRKRLLFVSVVIFGLSGTSACYLDSLYMLIAGRAILGLAVGAISTACIALIADYYDYDSEKRQKIIGIQVSFMSLGSMIVLVVGGMLADISWRYPFYLYSIAFFIIPVGMYYITEPRRPRPREISQDKPGQEAFPYLKICSIYGLTFIITAATFLTGILFPFFAEELSVTSSTKLGLALASTTIVISLGASYYGRIKSRFRFMDITMTSILLSSIGFFVLYQSSVFAFAIIGLYFLSMGMALFLPNINLWVNTVSPEAYRGRAIGGLTTCHFLGRFVSPFLAQPLTNHLSLASTFGVVGCFLLVFVTTVYLVNLRLRKSASV